MTDMAMIKASLEEKLCERMARAEEIENDLSQADDDDRTESAIESQKSEVNASSDTDGGGLERAVGLLQ